MARNPFGYAIDYNKEIELDNSRIAQLTNPLMLKVATELLPEAMATFPDFRSWDVFSLIDYKREGRYERAAAFGLTRDDLRALNVFSGTPGPFAADDGEPQSGDFTRGEGVALNWMNFEVLTIAEHKKALAHARASLARHLRNKERNQ
jgi:hypothetical protein